MAEESVVFVVEFCEECFRPFDVRKPKSPLGRRAWMCPECKRLAANARNRRYTRAQRRKGVVARETNPV